MSIAGYHLLMILSAVDGDFSPEEGLSIVGYLEEEFPFSVDLDDELAIIAALKPEEWEKHFTFHAECFLEDSTEKERVKFLAFAKTLIKIDGGGSQEEYHYYKLLKKIWKTS